MADELSFDEEIDRRKVPALKVHRLVLGDDGDSLFAAGVADMDFKAPPPVRDALRRRIEHGVLGYEAVPDGLLPAIIGWQNKRNDWHVDAAHILHAPNILNALAVAVSLFTEEGDGVIVQPPVFFDFYDILRENHRRCVANPLRLDDGCYTMDFKGLEELASDPRVKMIFLCNPHNPVGRVWTDAELRRLGDICARNDILVVSDEMHGDLAFTGHKYTPFAALGPEYAANSITCLSPAKTFNIASCCSAFTVIPDDEKRQKFQAENSRLTINKNNAFANVAMEAAFTLGEPWLRDVLSYLEANVELVQLRLDGLKDVKLIVPEGTFLLWLDFRELGLAPDELNSFLREQAGWAVTRGLAFGEEGAGFARLNIGCTHAKLAAALEQLANALRNRT